MFIGREIERSELLSLKNNKKTSFVVCSGRRRIGKSTLIENVGVEFKNFYEFQGLHPKEASKQTQQLDHFSEKIRLFFKTPKMKFTSWTEAFTELAQRLNSQSTLIFLDEISWMSSGSETFSAELKSAWDILYKKHPNLVFVVAGSVSSWIDENILNNSNFLGRVTLNLRLDELSLQEAQQFWSRRNVSVSSYNLVKTLAIFGGVPLYLELQNPKESVEQNIQRLCFNKSGPLVDEFDKIFSDIFSRRGPVYKKIVKQLLEKPKNLIELAKALGVEKSGSLSEYLGDLRKSGFLEADVTYAIDGKPTKSFRYRVCDNFIRFALKYVEPQRDKIKSGLRSSTSLDHLPQWSTIVGLQFENLILKNKNLVLKKLGISSSSIISCSPYFQKKTVKNKGSCQIDLLIVLKNFQIYLCEIKMKTKITSATLDEIKNKIKILKRPRHYSIQPVLIYCGEVVDQIRDSQEWLILVSIDDLLI